MDKYDYIIVGGGPTGMTLAWLLEDKKRKILLIDKENELGGCHRVHRVNGYFSEHGPRVYSNGYLMFIEILKQMDICFKHLYVEYKAKISKIGNKTASSFNKKEKSALFWGFIKLIFNENYGKDISMAKFMDNNHFSDNSKDWVARFCRLTDGADVDDYTLFQFLQISNQHYFYKLYQPVLPNDKGLIKLWEKKLVDSGNVTIMKNTKVLKLNKSGDKITSITYTKDGVVKEVYAGKIILAVPPKPLYHILNDSLDAKNAFGDITKLKEWKSKNSYFDYIPLTFHYFKEIKLPNIEGFPTTDWGIGFIILSNYMDFSDEPSKTVISITITFPERQNKYGKTVHECTQDEIIQYVKEELNFFPEPDLVIISPNVVKSGDKWINMDTAYVVTTDNKFLKETSDEFTNLFAVGIFNGNSNYSFTAMESAVQNAIHFAKKEIKDLKYEMPLQKAIDITDVLYSVIMVTIAIILLVIVKFSLYYNYKKK